MRTWIAMLVLALGMLRSGHAQPVDKEKLRQLVKLPRMSVGFGFGFSTTRGFTILQERPDVPAEIASLQKDLKGNASDAERYYRLGLLHKEAEDETRATEALTKAIDLYRQRVKAEPNNGVLLSELAEALNQNGKEEEGESLLRKAVQVAPKEWRCWTALGQFLGGRTVPLLLKPDRAAESDDPGKLLTLALQTKPSADQIREADKLSEEAAKCFDTAVAAAPENPEPYALRGSFRAFVRGFVQGLINTVRGGEANPLVAMLSPEALADFRQVVKLKADDCRILGTAALSEILSAAVQSGQQPADLRDLWGPLPETSKQAVHKIIGRLQELAKSNDKRGAASAFGVLGILQFFAEKDSAVAEASLRRAIGLDPSCEQAWDMLTVLLVTAERFADGATLFEERVKHKDSAYNRLLLAKAYGKLNQFEKAEAQVQAALKVEPEDFTANLALAALVLKRSDEAGELSKTGELLDKAGKLLGESPSQQQRNDYTLTRGLYLALTGKVEDAKQQLQKVLDDDPEDKEAKAALEALKQ